MRNLSTAQNNKFDKFLKKLEKHETALKATVAKYIEFEAEWSEVKNIESSTNTIIREVVDFVRDITESMDTYFNEKSDNWRDGSAGSSYTDWMRAWNVAHVLMNELELEQPHYRAGFTFEGVPALRLLEDLDSQRTFNG